MFVGGCAGFTAGGIKVIRVLIVFRTIFQNIFRMVHPRAVTPLERGDRILPEGMRAAILGLFAAWFMVFVLATFLVAIQEDLNPVLLGDHRGDHAERGWAGAGTGRGLGELRGREHPRQVRA